MGKGSIRAGNQTGENADTAAGRYAKSIGLGLFCGILCTAALLLLSAWMIGKFGVPVTFIGGIAAVCVCIGAFVFGFSAGGSFGRKGLIIGCICCLLYVLILTVGNLIVFGLRFEVSTAGKLLVSAVLCILGAFLGAYRAQKKRKPRYR